MIASLGTWIRHPIYSLFLTFDGIVYSLVSYAYKIFILMSQMNYNVIYSMMSPLINRVKAVIVVFILFKAAAAFLGYLVEPEKFDDKTKGGKALFTNIMIAACLLGIYSFVFKLGNDVSMLVLGTFGGSGSFQVLKVQSGEDLSSGLLTRFIFGKKDYNTDNFGVYLATSTLHIFLYDKTTTSNQANNIYSKIVNNVSTTGKDTKNDLDLMEIVDLADDIGRTVSYKYPLLSTVMGMYLIYSIVKIAVEVGVRMFKLIVLQIIAPIPIVTIISDGINGQMFKKFINLYMGAFTGVFIRVGSMYMITAFIGEFQQQIFGTSKNGSLFSGTSTTDLSLLTKGILLIILIVAGYTFVNQLPKFLGQLFGEGFGGDDKGGFGKFLKGVAGAGVGFVGGTALGAAQGLGVGASALNGLIGGYQGAKSGSEAGKGQFVSSQIKNLEGQSARGNKFAEYGVGGTIGRGISNATGAAAAEKNRLELANKQMQASNDKMKGASENAAKAIEKASSSRKYANGSSIAYGKDRELFGSTVADNDTDYRNLLQQAEQVGRELNANAYTDDYSTIVNADGSRNITKTAASKRSEAIEQKKSLQADAEARHREVATDAAKDYDKAQTGALDGTGYTVESIKTETKANNEKIKVNNERLGQLK